MPARRNNQGTGVGISASWREVSVRRKNGGRKQKCQQKKKATSGKSSTLEGLRKKPAKSLSIKRLRRKSRSASQTVCRDPSHSIRHEKKGHQRKKIFDAILRNTSSGEESSPDPLAFERVHLEVKREFESSQLKPLREGTRESSRMHEARPISIRRDKHPQKKTPLPKRAQHTQGRRGGLCVRRGDWLLPVKNDAIKEGAFIDRDSTTTTEDEGVLSGGRSGSA